MQLELKDLTKKYGNFTALDRMTFTFTPGIYGILGANGAGKSTMMNLLTDNISRTGGQILFDGTDILKLGKDFRRVLGYMPQQQGFYEHMTAQTFLYYMAELKGIPKKAGGAGDRRSAGGDEPFPCPAQKAGRLFRRYEAAGTACPGPFGRPQGGHPGRAYRWS